jgi:hypothetical protein
MRRQGYTVVSVHTLVLGRKVILSRQDANVIGRVGGFIGQYSGLSGNARLYGDLPVACIFRCAYGQGPSIGYTTQIQLLPIEGSVKAVPFATAASLMYFGYYGTSRKRHAGKSYASKLNWSPCSESQRCR